jgi:ribonucleoside-triphosphate reductase
MNNTEKTSALQDFIFISKYARTVEGKKETWEQAVQRVMNMHKDFLNTQCNLTPEKWEQLWPYYKEAKTAYLKREILGSQRTLQWGGEQLIKHNLRSYNCTSSYANRVDFFHELMYILLAGAGAGYSVQRHHVDQIPEVKGMDKSEERIFQVPDSIEGWALAIKKLTYSHFYGTTKIVFDYSNIRPKGAYISGGFKAPGPGPLKIAIGKINEILLKARGRKLTPFEVHRVACLVADAVVSGGVRRSALIAIFSNTDEEMMSCKTGDWYVRFPELARSNNSVVLTPDVPKSQYDRIFESTKQFGEPGIVLLKSTEFAVNPCVEVAMYPTLHEDGKMLYGWSGCNLSETNGKYIKTQEDFIRIVRAAAIIGTFQATYTNFPFLGKTTEMIFRRDALIGVGITGMAENPDIIFDDRLQRLAADEVKKVNREVAAILGINPAARTTVIKPSGNSSQMLGTSSGIHPFHSNRYIRNVQVNKEELAGKVYQKINPRCVTDSVWNLSRDYCISFPVEVKPGAIVKANLSAVEFMKMVASTQMNWIEQGTNFDHPSYKQNPDLRMNVSNTISVLPEEWDQVKEYLWDNKQLFCGISMISSTGDIDYPQAPYTHVFDERELAEMYGPATILAGGLIVDGIHAFGDLWSAISTVLGNGESLELKVDAITKIIQQNINQNLEFKYMVDGLLITDVNAVIAHQRDVIAKKNDWIRRFKHFSEKYMNGDIQKTGRCLKHVSVFHQWQQLKSTIPVDWNRVKWEEELVEAGADTASGCYGGACLI